MYEFVCRNCGKREVYPRVTNRQHSVYCDKKCQREYQERRRTEDAQKAKEKQRAKNALSLPKIPASQCAKCVYGLQIGGLWGCGYLFYMGHTRHSLHPEGLPDECQEFERRVVKRRRKSKKIITR